MDSIRLAEKSVGTLTTASPVILVTSCLGMCQTHAKAPIGAGIFAIQAGFPTSNEVGLQTIGLVIFYLSQRITNRILTPTLLG
jgi:hypothetical protein